MVFFLVVYFLNLDWEVESRLARVLAGEETQPGSALQPKKGSTAVKREAVAQEESEEASLLLGVGQVET